MKIKDGLEVKELNFAEWYLNILTPQVVLANSIWHGSYKDLSVEDKAKAIDKQVSVIVMEEMVDEYRDWETDRKSTRLNSSHSAKSRMPSSA